MKNALDSINSTSVCSCTCVICSFSWICSPMCLHRPGPRHTRTVALMSFPVPFYSPSPLLFLSFTSYFPYLKRNQTETEQMEVIRTHTRELCVCKPGVLQTSPQSSLRLGLILLLYLQTALLSQPRIHKKKNCDISKLVGISGTNRWFIMSQYCKFSRLLIMALSRNLLHCLPRQHVFRDILWHHKTFLWFDSVTAGLNFSSTGGNEPR